MYTTDGHLQNYDNEQGIEFQCNFFVVPGNGPALLDMTDCKRLQLLSINCNTISADSHRRQVSKQDKFKTNKILKLIYNKAKELNRK